ncbi:MAG: glycosyltransferase [Pelagibacterium sp.]|jgi:glycosyltransferase involved in cell wall biosynthesis|uniref:glycosyltransferase n=1 Tax=Pelagibacterium sp. TaxID=1967288 RepID=UPI0032EC0BC7
MRIWLIRDLEPIPTDPGDRRLMRMGMLAQTLARREHQTRWITSSFDHYQKRQRQPSDQEIFPEANLAISILPCPGYTRNISLARIRHNRAFARAFEKYARKISERPDIIVTDIPTTEAAACAVAFGRRNAIPVVISIRDLWPDFFTDLLPTALRPLARPLLFPLGRQARQACSGASSIVGISEDYLDWGLAKAGRARSDKDRVFPLGYAARELPPVARRESILSELGVRPSARLVTFVGSWGHTYDLKLVLDLARRLRDRSDIQFLVAGNGEQSKRLLPEFSELPNVLAPGWINAEQISVLLNRADIGLLPYTENAPQGLPNKIFEYMAYGTYQIATKKGEIESAYGSTGAGMALQSPDAETLAHAICMTLGTGTVNQERPNRVQYFRDHWNAEIIYGRFADHIVALAKNAKI